ncbi:MAG: NUDIX hydrolase [Lachnospiraceae bacterium]|nr:NUDIX hydrolase [Lachnospiraceae bacterium]
MEIRKEQIKTLFDAKFLRVYDLQYAPMGHYYSASRRSMEDLPVLKDEAAYAEMLPDAVSMVVIIKDKAGEAKLLLAREYRYPAGRFLLSVPAGLLDAADKAEKEPLFAAARRELQEEAGLILTEADRMSVVNPLLFSTPGMTDESNGIVCVVAERENLDGLTQEGAEGQELFGGFALTDMETARKYLKDGRDAEGVFYSVFTWIALMWFVSGMWKE